MLYLRLLVIALVVGFAIYFLRRLVLGLVRNPYWRQNLARWGIIAARLLVLRRLFPLLARAFRMLRFFR